MTRPDLYKSPANRKPNTRHRGDLSESRQAGEPLVPASVLRLMRAFAGACIVMLVCGPGALALTSGLTFWFYRKDIFGGEATVAITPTGFAVAQIRW